MTVAFPGAEGFGAVSVGGRGGTVYEVTNTDDSGSGSFREAVEASGARTVVFRTGGTITLESELVISNPYITIAGQTAPGGGICLKGSSAIALQVKTHDVIMRYLRTRMGYPLTIAYDTPYNVIIDHCSLSWTVDENVNIYFDAHDITIQWCILSESLLEGKGMMVGSDGAENISVHHNLFVHNYARNPYVNTSGTVDVVNNVAYNSGAETAFISDSYAKGIGNFVGNYYKRGGDSDTHYYLNIGAAQAYGDDVYLQGNITPNRPTDDLPENFCVHSNDRDDRITTTRNNAPLITTTSAAEALVAVLADAGANKTLDSLGVSSDNRDSVDTRIVADVKATTGSIIDDPSDVSGWPTLAAGTAPTDTDSDGMPDDWENLYLLDPNDSSDNIIDENRDGYDNLEDYLNGVPLRQIDPEFVPSDMTQTTANLTDSIRTQRAPR